MQKLSQFPPSVLSNHLPTWASITNLGKSMVMVTHMPTQQTCEKHSSRKRISSKIRFHPCRPRGKSTMRAVMAVLLHPSPFPKPTTHPADLMTWPCWSPLNDVSKDENESQIPGLPRRKKAGKEG